MWARFFKNFVCGPSAAVAIGRRPCPGAIGEEHAAGGQRAGRLAAIGHAASEPGGWRPSASEPGGRPVWPSAIGHAPLVLWWGAMWAVST